MRLRDIEKTNIRARRVRCQHRAPSPARSFEGPLAVPAEFRRIRIASPSVSAVRAPFYKMLQSLFYAISIHPLIHSHTALLLRGVPRPPFIMNICAPVPTVTFPFRPACTCRTTSASSSVDACTSLSLGRVTCAGTHRAHPPASRRSRRGSGPGHLTASRYRPRPLPLSAHATTYYACFTSFLISPDRYGPGSPVLSLLAGSLLSPGVRSQIFSLAPHCGLAFFAATNPGCPLPRARRTVYP